MTSARRATIIPQVLISVGLALIVIVGFTFVRAGATFEKASVEQQSSYTTHDISVIQHHRAPYVGDNSNTIQALFSLPLSARIDRVEIHDTDVVVILKDGPAAEERENALYSAIAFMSAVDNTTSVRYQSGVGAYTISRAAVEQRFGKPLGKLLDSAEEWQRVRTLVPLEADSLVS